MKERPILFSAPMVRAILNGSKTQTRRVVKPQPKHAPYQTEDSIYELGAEWFISHGWVGKCPYGQPGDQLWLRETHSVRVKPEDATDGVGRAWYAADHIGHDIKWKPSIHMPRWASRIQLEITNIRVERLQDCSEADALAEGVTLGPTHPRHQERMARDAYRELWESINGPGSWDANPWVWCVTFRRIKP